MQGKLLAQGVAEFVIVVDDQDLARVSHWPSPTDSEATKLEAGFQLDKRVG
jgi:hypothetical protein